ncbi:membrane protein [Jannaschia pagri]|uniref:Membrane protein n=1 Tax=Jannaschia pagri TaxID=2829797 RepID=A0ABQ4NI17_9RHOB|nr:MULTISPECIES: DUF599 domain-containing protein [unclassified Jannaschia]GIT90055.1 membrane protein [Jannaschia sp. AI_61]GIT93839.1 membrane protein [Jannaschia sp. AI_62]
MLTLLQSTFTPLDLMALGFLLMAWAGSGWLIENPPAKRTSVTVLMRAYRHDWMVEMLTRQPRIFDAAILDSLRQGTTFMTSAAIIAVGGVLALAGNAERLDSIVMGVGIQGHPAVFWQVKLGVVALLLTYAVFKFIWSNRLFGYCAVVMASVPNDVEDPRALPRANKAAEINIRAALNFNRGLRSVYFAFTALAWVLGPWGLLIATAVTLRAVLSREFASTSRGVLLDE